MPGKERRKAFGFAQLVTSMALASTSNRSNVSVVMPCHNQGALLARALDMHLGQTLPPQQIVVVDDGSTDNSLKVAEAYARCHEEVEVVSHPTNRGVVSAVCTGLARARATYVRSSPVDDELTPDFLERMLDVLHAHPEAGLAFADPAERRAGRVTRFSHHLADAPRYFGPGELRWILKRGFFTISVTATVYRKDALEAIGGFPEELAWQADWYTNFAVMLRYGACYVPGNFSVTDMSPTSYSARHLGNREESRLFLAILARLKGPDREDLWEAFRDSALMSYYAPRMLLALLRDPVGRAYLTPHLCARTLFQTGWRWIRPWTPLTLRDRARRAVAQRVLG